jgi:TonB-linked SusC/RagA family outer membrane protein
MNVKSFLAALLLLCTQQIFAQKSVSGTVVDSDSGSSIPGVTVMVDGTGSGVATDFDGKYKIDVSGPEAVLVFSFVGYNTQRIKVGERSNIDVTLAAGVELDEVVVTALGVSREKKALGYSIQEVSGDDMGNARESNVVSAMSGKVAGVQVYSSSNLGGSSRLILRGNGSILGENQPLYVVNGVPIDNSSFTTANQSRGAGGYDFGTPINDINPDDIESVSVLKGPAAAALYGSRAANGAVIITTKGGTLSTGACKGLGIEVNSGISFQNVAILPEYQNEFGGGAGPNWLDTINGAFIPDYGYDGSWGPALEGQNARHWDSWFVGDPEYGKARPWEANPTNVEDFFRTGVTFTNNFAVTGGGENTSYRLSYTNHNQTGTQENSELRRNLLSFTGGAKISDKLTSNVNINYAKTNALGRPLTGYSESVMSQFNQWFQRQLNMDRLREYENPDGSQRTWNPNDAVNGDMAPHYWDNPFWERYKNVENDSRERVYGSLGMTYQINDWLSLTGRGMTDLYTDRREERIATGGVRIPKYSETIRTVKETNFDAILNLNRDLSEDLTLTGLVGVNQRLRTYNLNSGETQGGLNTPGFYSLANSASELLTKDELSTKKVNSAFAQASFGYKRMLYVDITGRNDWSSTLPADNNSYFYPSATASFIVSEVLDASWLSFAKVRLGWAQVGNDTDPYQTTVSYLVNPNFGSNPNASVPNSLYNADLRPEKTSGLELGLEGSLLLDKIRFDVTFYKQTTEDFIFNVSQSASTGYSSRLLNAGTVENTGVELMLGGTPVETESGFRWDVSINWSKNNNELVEIAEGIETIRLTSLFGVALEARVGEPLYTFMGYDYQYDDAGNKLVDADGVYLTTDEIVPIGTTQADWTGGLTNTFSYKGVSLYLHVDMQKGGSLHSYSNQWGRYSGMFIETVENNIREDGIVVEGVYAPGTTINDQDVSGQTNSTVLDAQSHFFLNGGYVVHAADQYDATFIKLREARLSYTLPRTLTESWPICNVQIAAYGRNLWLIHSNVPHIDPEVAVSSSNVQGFEGGQLPIERSIGFNLSFNI